MEPVRLRCTGCGKPATITEVNDVEADMLGTKAVIGVILPCVYCKGALTSIKIKGRWEEWRGKKET